MEATFNDRAVHRGGDDVVAWLETLAEHLPATPAYTHLRDGDGDEDAIDFGTLRDRVHRIAAGLVERGLVGRAVVLALPTGLDYVATLLGCMRAGAIPVPCVPTTRGAGLERWIGITVASRAAVAIVDATTRDRALELPVPRLAPEDIAVDVPPHALAAAPAGTPALLQFTSGTTDIPKGVVVTHQNLAHNLRQMCFTGPIDGVSWLPPHHDMGLVGGVLHGIARAGHTVLISPLHFVQRPIRWLRAITRFRAVGSPGPDFAYRLCVERISDEELATLDLSSWRYAFSGAEPIAASTLDAFAERFAPAGFRSSAFLPCYGLAEATLMVTRGELRRPPARVRVDAVALHEGRAESSTGPGTRELVGSGRAIADTEVLIVDEEGRPCPDGVVGEVVVRGPSVCPGYLDTPTARRAVVGRGAGFLSTGDLGVLRDGELFVTDRIKDVIVVRGRNLSPAAIELAARNADPRLSRSVVAAIGTRRDGHEALVVIVERTSAWARADIGALSNRIADAVAAAEGIRPAEVIVVKPGRIPRTTSGKVRRGACRIALEQGALQPEGLG